MAVAAASAISELRSELQRLVNDPGSDPADKVDQLRELRDDLAFLTGEAERYISDQELLREGTAMDRVRSYLGAREGADVRGEMLDRRLATPEQLDAAGLVSHDELDQRSDDGTVEEAVVGVAHLFDATKHPRGRGGKFASTGRVVPRGRSGNTLSAPKGAGHEPERVFSTGDHPGESPLFLGGVRSQAVRNELGSARDTVEKHGQQASPGTTGQRVYTPERMALHRQWIEKLFADGGRGEGVAAQRHKKGDRQMVFVAGGPASGKSSADEYMPKIGNSVEIDQDWFKNQIPEYQHLAEQRDPYASDSAHREAADLATQALAEATRRGYNVVVQGTGNSGPGQFAGKMVKAHQAGYRVHAFGVSAPTDVAMQRAQFRAKEQGRAVPEAGLRAMHANVSRRWKEVEAIAPEHLESLQLFDSREDKRQGGKARLMEHMNPDSKAMEVDNPGRMSEFRAKEHEDPGELIREPTYV